MFEEYPIIHKSICKTQRVLNNYSDVTVSVSGGSDSDIMLAIIDLVKHDITPKIHYMYFDTGLEYDATKEHIKYLSDKYKIEIETFKPKTPIPTAVKRHGVPFISKRISNYISRLQKHGFDWSADNFETLYKKYPKCKAALRWFTNEFGGGSRFNIAYTKGLREYLLTNPPKFNISDMCCTCAKKKTAAAAMQKYNTELSIQGLRKAEGGARNTLTNCWNKDDAVFYPLLWYRNSEKTIIEQSLNVVHSRCYSEYGLKRTGCAGCPFGQDYIKELEIIKEYEPKLYNACINIFGISYEYTNNFKKFRQNTH